MREIEPNSSKDYHYVHFGNGLTFVLAIHKFTNSFFYFNINNNSRAKKGKINL